MFKPRTVVVPNPEPETVRAAVEVVAVPATVAVDPGDLRLRLSALEVRARPSHDATGSPRGNAQHARRPRDSLADNARFARRAQSEMASGTQTRCDNGLGRAFLVIARYTRNVGRRSLFPQMGFDHLHPIAIARFGIGQ